MDIYHIFIYIYIYIYIYINLWKVTAAFYFLSDKQGSKIKSRSERTRVLKLLLGECYESTMDP